MLEYGFAQPSVITRLRHGPLGPHLETLATTLHQHGYARNSIRGYLRACHQFGQWLSQQGHTIADVDTALVAHYLHGRPPPPIGRRSKAAAGAATSAHPLAAARAAALCRSTATTDRHRRLARAVYAVPRAGLRGSRQYAHALSPSRPTLADLLCCHKASGVAHPTSTGPHDLSPSRSGDYLGRGTQDAQRGRPLLPAFSRLLW